MQAKAERTLGIWIPRYLNAIRNKNYSEKTVKTYSDTLRRFAQFKASAGPDVVDTTADEITDFFGKLRQDSPQGQLKPATVHQYSAALRAFYKYLLRQDVVSVNPMDKVERPKIKGRETIRLHHDEVMRFIESLRARSALTGARDALIVRTIYATGMRISEVCNLCIEDIDFAEESIRVLGKGGKVRTVMCDEITLQMIREYVGDRNSGPVFVYHGHPIEPQTVQRVFRLYAPAGITPHKIRHSFASEFYRATHDLRVLQETLGHESIQTTQIYVHTDKEEQRKAYQSFPLACGM